MYLVLFRARVFHHAYPFLKLLRVATSFPLHIVTGYVYPRHYANVMSRSTHRVLSPTHISLSPSDLLVHLTTSNNTLLFPGLTTHCPGHILILRHHSTRVRNVSPVNECPSRHVCSFPTLNTGHRTSSTATSREHGGACRSDHTSVCTDGQPNRRIPTTRRCISQNS